MFQELGPRNRVHRANIAGGAATAIAAAIYILAGLFGYIYAGPDTKGNIINSRKKKYFTVKSFFLHIKFH